MIVPQRELNQYAALMGELRRRLEVVQTFTDGTTRTLYRRTDTETVCLQIRKCLELVAFASLVANRTVYEQVRSDIAKDWHAGRILRKVREINPSFYPRPVRGLARPTLGISGGFLLAKTRHLTQKQFEALYDRCGDLLHATNPFSAEASFAAFYRYTPLYLLRIRELVRSHLVTLAGSRAMLWTNVPDNDSEPVLVQLLCQEHEA